jgi:Fe-S cluster assembly ATP-binding protein
MLSIKNLSVNVDDLNILDDINLDILDGEIHVLMGPNGAGKSSITKVISGNKDYLTKGSIIYNGEELLNKSITDIALSGIYVVNQNPIEVEGVSNALMLRTLLNERNKENIDIFKFNKELEDICKKLDLDKSFIHKDINVSCSGGERKKIELMHMWVIKPSFIILDEIDSGLDVDSIKVVMNNIKEYYLEYMPSILIITHEERLIKYFDNYLVHVLNNKKIVKSGDKLLAMDVLKNGFKNI